MKYLAVPVIAGALLASGCGGTDTAGPCVGVIKKLYTQQRDPVMVNAGSGVMIPIGGGTNYYLYITRDDGSSCSRHVNKNTWLAKREGERYMYGALPS